MRGEHPSSARIPLRQLGSSPHARGTQVNVTADQTPGGIIPACAGNTRTGRCPGRPGRDHPRMRGEHPEQSWDDWRTEGSSPHARGTPCRRWCRLPHTGIIPACAGNTCAYHTHNCPRRDHPRMRGEHVSEARERNRVMGSSPHARGTLSAVLLDLRIIGIIPACAGNTEL